MGGGSVEDAKKLLLSSAVMSDENLDVPPNNFDYKKVFTREDDYRKKDKKGRVGCIIFRKKKNRTSNQSASGGNG